MLDVSHLETASYCWKFLGLVIPLVNVDDCLTESKDILAALIMNYCAAFIVGQISCINHDYL